MWPTNVTLPNGDRYSYSVASSPTPERDIAGEFAASCHKYNITPGFYMYMDTNAYLGVVNNKLVGKRPLIGTLDAYNKLCLEQLHELWAQYGTLAEVWFDGGFNRTIQPNVTALFSKLQPSGVVFNGPGNPVGLQNALRWVGSERGYAPYPNWMATSRNADVPPMTGAGDPDGLIYAPPVCDTTLQTPTSTWLYDPFSSTPRNLSDLKQLYHQSVGRSCGLELNFAPMPNGSMAANFVTRLAEFGGWIKACYGAEAAVPVPGTKLPVGSAAGAVLDGASVRFVLSKSADRLVLQEDLKHGQRIRNFNVSDADGVVVYTGTSLGHKHIALLSRNVSGELVVTIDAAGGPQGAGAAAPKLRRVAAYSNAGC
jgi:alpha-L-fucosidase